MKEEDQAHHAHDDDFLDEFLFQRRNRPLDEIRSVVGGDKFHSRRKGRRDLFDFCFNALDHFKRVFTITHNNHATHDFTIAVQFGEAAAHVRPDRDLGDVSQCDRRSAAHANANGLKVFDRTYVAPAPHHVFRSAQLYGSPSDVVVAHADRVSNGFNRNAVRGKFVRIQIDLILLDETSQARHLGDPFNTRQLIAKIPILQTSELREIVFAALFHQRVLKHPADSGGIRPQDRRHPLWKAA